jgi:hypothetical protein
MTVAIRGCIVRTHRFVLVVVAAGACTTSSSSSHSITVTASFVADQSSGTGQASSPIAPLLNQPIDLEVTIDHPNIYHMDADDPQGCHSTYLEVPVAGRTASGPAAPTVSAQILDPLPDWFVRVELCDTPASSIVQVVATIDRLNLQYGCATIPMESQVFGSDHYPELVSMTATDCSSTILDVSDNFQIGNTGFTMTIATGPSHLP